MRDLRGARKQEASRKYLADLECAISDSFGIQGLGGNARHFFAMESPLAANPFLMQLQNATVGIRGNVKRPITPIRLHN